MSSGTLTTLIRWQVVIGGSAAVLVGLVLMRDIVRRLSLRIRGYVATALLVDCVVHEATDPEEPDHYEWIVDFTARDGQRHRGVSLDSWENHFPGVGRTTPVVYRPGNPRWAARTTWVGMFLTLPLYFGFGLFMLVLGLVWL